MLFLKMVTSLRFEDSRLPSPHVGILRAILRNFPQRRLHLVKALSNAITLRLEWVCSCLLCNNNVFLIYMYNR